MCTMQVCTVGLREDVLDRVGEAFQAIAARNQDVLDAARLELVHDLQPETWRPSVCSIQMPSTSRRPSSVDADRQIDRLVADDALVPDLHDERIEEDDRVHQFERPVFARRARLRAQRTWRSKSATARPRRCKALPGGAWMSRTVMPRA
jgi:hypothetical protein